MNLFRKHGVTLPNPEKYYRLVYVTIDLQKKKHLERNVTLSYEAPDSCWQLQDLMF